MNPGGEQAGLLEREAAAARLAVPRALKALEPDLQKASARIRAFGLQDPFREDRLRCLPPGTLRTAVEEVRKAGLMTEGVEWAARRNQVPALVEALQKSFQRQLDLERDLPGIARGI